MTMFERVAAAGVSIARQAHIRGLETDLARLTAEMSSGRKADPARELGVGAALLYRLYDDIQQGEALKNATSLAGERLKATQTALDSVGALMDQMSPEILKTDVLKGNGFAIIASNAREILGSMTDLLNTHWDGQNLFGGTDNAQPPIAPATALLGWAQDQKDLAAASGALDAAGAAGLIGSFDAMFANVQRAADGSSFYGLVYRSASRTDMAGSTDAESDAPSRVRIGAGETLEYNVRADNQSFRDAFKSLSLLSLLDAPAAELDEDARAALLDEAGELMRGARAQLTVLAGVLGSKQQRLSNVAAIQDRAIAAATAQINDLEGTDYYTVSDRIGTLRIQLEATYAITARLSELSLVNYL
ncbi:flagellar hook protein [Pseudoroseomonas rhizosphaerae]|uniref:Flagellin n=1 Tax=Teichococcus rhizosphaerae TaxID=1335062 RepID=A0A2C6Z5C1_9PROT|nr:flagellin [Pseudoroseomonas rhizosphaerae]PHK93691.1 flagellar hook protein [Pseudoroseomonas rhizosphaerae]